MKFLLKIFAIIISIFILLLPIMIFVLHMIFSPRYIIRITDTNKDEIIECLKKDNILVDYENINKLKVKYEELRTQSVLIFEYDNHEIAEWYLKSDEYNIIKYLDENTINIDSIITRINLIVLFLVIIFIIYCVKKK